MVLLKEFGMHNKIKVVWLCHFSNESIQNRLPLWKKSEVYAAWITNTLEGFKNSNEFEIHVISPHQYLKRDYSFEEDGIFYHFYAIGMPIINRSWPAIFRFDLFCSFWANRRKIKKLVKTIQPDLINLHGAENSYYSSSALDFYEQYPLLVTIQGFISLEVNSKNDSFKQNRIAVESEIIKNCKYFCGDKDSQSVISSMRNIEFNFFNFYYPNGSNITQLSKRKSEKSYDLLFWGRIIKDKGAEDFLSLVAQLKVNFPNIKACYIGPVVPGYLDFLKDRAKELDCEENVDFKGFINFVDDLYTEVLKAKILVLPTYNDRFPTVLREAVCLRIAVIGYATGSIPQFNLGEERVLLADQGDIDKLVSHAGKLLDDEVYFEELTEKAFDHGLNEFSINTNTEKIITAYKSVLRKENKL
ncbi:glycosyltransferase family 4 protein [Pedobacter immunditicola]|uniref:glycosyltransferase family 4 protein n=1 Tax=Pedobacter immunditicola TaxID=3133440 RepID=UPI0030AF6DAF